MGPKGQRLVDYAPHGHWKTLAFIVALHHDRVGAPWVIDGPINREWFALYVEQVLAPTLKKGDVVIIDNLGSHKPLSQMKRDAFVRRDRAGREIPARG